MQSNHVKALVAGFLLAGVAYTQAAPASPQGVITEKVWLNIGGGTAVTDLTGNARFPDNPDTVKYQPYFEYCAGGDINVPAVDTYDSAGAQLVGYFYPPTTGEYIFYLCSDDGGNLYLSTDATAANKKLIAQEAGWSGARSYTTMGGGSTIEAKCSATYAGTQWPNKVDGLASIILQAGQAYYIEALMKEGGGGDNLSVAVQDPNYVIDPTLPIPGQYLSSFDKSSGPLSIVTQPQSQTVNQGEAVTFSVVVDGTPPYTYEWRRGGAPIAGATGPSYTIDRAASTDNGAVFSVYVTGAAGSPVTSANATLTVITDATAPTLVLARGSVSFTTVTVTFSEPVDSATAQAVGNYSIPGLTISAAVQKPIPDDNQVVLTTAKQGEGAEYTLTVSNVKDIAGNTIAPNSTIGFKAFVLGLGWASYERWNNENGDPGAIDAFAMAVTDGTIRVPDYSASVNQFGAPWGVRDNYSSKVSAFFIPPSNGNYVFFLASDDASYLYLSTDETPANKKLIAREAGWSNQYQWQTIGGGSDPVDKRSDTCSITEWGNYDGVITLTAGRRYYIEILHDEGGGGDGADATFIKAGEADPAQNAAGMFLKGSVIASYLDPTGAAIDITQPPQDTTQQEERTATFTVTATGTSAYGTTVTYQWQRQAPGGTTWTDIAGATEASYTTPILTMADSGAKYRVNCTVPTLTVASDAATLTVVGDTFAPTVEMAGTILNGTAIEIGVGFDENVDEVTASAAANYTLSKGSVTGVRYQRFAHTDGAGFFKLGTAGPFYGAAVVLTTSGLATGDTVTVTVNGIKDVKGNTMTTPVSKLVKVTSKMKWTTIGGNDILDGYIAGIDNSAALWPEDVVAYSEADFDLIGSGTANWDAYDEATFVYEEVTGDFDKVVRVEYHDPTSQWARAGLCATPSADTGMARGGTLSKRFMQRCNPAIMWNGNAGNNQHEADWRLTDGGNYGGAGAGIPAYPNAWLRMQRAGQMFTAFYSADGKNWTQYGQTTFSTEPMPDTLLVGPYYCPEYINNNTAQGVQHSAVGKFRQYGSYVANPSVVTYGIGLNFGADEPSSGNGGVLPSIATAGAAEVLQGNWNNLTLLSGTSATVVADKLGVSAPTAVSVTWNSANTWSSTGRGEENNGFTGNDKALMLGYLDTGNATTSTVDISGIPAELTAAENGYDVYIYCLGGVAGRGGGYRITAADGTTALTDYVDVQSAANPTAHVQAVPVPGSWVAATYVKFTGLKAAAIQVQATTAGGHGFSGTPRAPINAIQLVPSTGGVAPEFTSVARNADGSITVTWTGGGTLQVTTDIGSGVWQNVAGAASPYTFTPEAPALFGRIVK